MTATRINEFGAETTPRSAEAPSVEHHSGDLPGGHRKAARESGKDGWRRWWRALLTYLDAASDARREWRRFHI
jgi:hypothetical protein